ncbi:MAG TPA: acyltransferase [Polyangiaceae bacterium]|nr:acyltransferase [Polyangiaceae bacterium]
MSFEQGHRPSLSPGVHGLASAKLPIPTGFRIESRRTAILRAQRVSSGAALRSSVSSGGTSGTLEELPASSCHPAGAAVHRRADLVFFPQDLGLTGLLFELLPHLGASLLYAHNQIFGRQSDINVVSWSLEVEVQFYLLVPLLAFVLFQIRWRLARRIGIASLCVAAAVVARSFPRDGSWNLSFAGQSAFFLAGLLLADVCCLQSRKRKPHFAWDLCCLTAFGCVLAARFYDSRWWVLSALAMAVCYYAMFRGSWIRRILSWLPIATIGGMSYSIYLLHNYVIALGGMVSERTGATLPFGARLAIQSAILAPLVLSVAAVFYLAIERPCMRPDWPARLRRGLARH